MKDFHNFIGFEKMFKNNKGRFPLLAKVRLKKRKTGL